jgi:NO-binding membrane sensor protein with MHYT domain
MRQTPHDQDCGGTRWEFGRSPFESVVSDQLGYATSKPPCLGPLLHRMELGNQSRRTISRSPHWGSINRAMFVSRIITQGRILKQFHISQTRAHCGSFPTMTSMDSTIVGSYNYPVAALAVCISVLASYTALDLAERISASYGMVRRQVWLISGGVVLGIGIWSMHFTAMWAFRIPAPVEYYWPLVLLSFLEVVVASIIALAVVSRKTLGMRAAMAGSLFQGAGISGLHYMAMASMRMPAMCHYSLPIVGLSVLVAVAGSLLSLWLTFLFGNRPTGGKLRKIAMPARTMSEANVCRNR